MIKSFKHKGLEIFFRTGNTKGINSQHTKKIRQILTILHTATDINTLDVPAFKLHKLSGDLKGIWAVKVSANYRIIFMFNELKVEVFNVDYIDYH